MIESQFSLCVYSPKFLSCSTTKLLQRRLDLYESKVFAKVVVLSLEMMLKILCFQVQHFCFMVNEEGHTVKLGHHTMFKF